MKTRKDEFNGEIFSIQQKDGELILGVKLYNVGHIFEKDMTHLLHEGDKEKQRERNKYAAEYNRQLQLLTLGSVRIRQNNWDKKDNDGLRNMH